MLTAKTNRRRAAHGFTLIEMLVVIIIIAVISSVIVPRYYDFAMKARFQASVQNVLSVFADARYKAVQSGADVVVRYDAQSALLIVESEVAPPGADQPVALQESPENTGMLPSMPTQLGENLIVSDFQIDNPQQQGQRGGTRQLEIHFHEDGRADAATILLAGAEGERTVIEVAPLTGQASIREDQQL
jgi:prepilin-type N-terminal cleavage/methylation domain-containing protein